MRQRIKTAKIKGMPIIPQPVVIVADTTFFKRSFGICVFRAPHLKKNLYWTEVLSETAEIYRLARKNLELMGFKILAVVLDGRKGIREIFHDLPVQMCHFHQQMIITRYLTTNPRLAASKELRSLAFALSRSSEEKFALKLESWHKKWEIFLKEKSINLLSGGWSYTHKRLRAAYRSLKTNLPFLFTFQKYPELRIPNTTNSLDGAFSHLKELVLIHRGLGPQIKRKMIQEILTK